jgi:Peptidase S8 pro-domain
MDPLIVFYFLRILLQIIDDHYHFHHNSVSKRSINPSHHHQTRLDADDRVRWSKQQRAKSRQKRDLVKIRNTRPWSSILLNDPKWPLMWYLVSYQLPHTINHSSKTGDKNINFARTLKNHEKPS